MTAYRKKEEQNSSSTTPNRKKRKQTATVKKAKTATLKTKSTKVPKAKKTSTIRKAGRLTSKQLSLKLQVADAFPNDQGRVPNNPLLAAGLAAIWKGGDKVLSIMGGWSESEVQTPVYYHNGKKGGRIVVYPNLRRDSNDPIPTKADLWELVKDFSPFTADVALAVLAQLCEPSSSDRPKYPLLESVRITADSILRYKGIQRWGAERRALKDRVFKEMEKLRALHFDVEKVPAWDPATSKWNGKGFSWRGDRLFDIIKVEQYQESLSGSREQLEYSWMVRAGQWAYWWLNAQGRIWIGKMAKILLELDHQGAALAKKIGQRLVLLNQALQTGHPLTLRIGNLLEELGELPSPQTRGRNWAGRTRDRFDSAMLTLKEIHVFSDVEWIDGYGPQEPRRHRGWSKKWLAARVVVKVPINHQSVEAPEKINQITSSQPTKNQQKIQSTSSASKIKTRIKPKRKRKTKIPENNAELLALGKQLKNTRKKHKWSQKHLASELGITASYLSQIENNKKRPSQKFQRNASKWLQQIEVN